MKNPFIYINLVLIPINAVALGRQLTLGHVLEASLYGAGTLILVVALAVKLALHSRQCNIE